MSSSTLMRLCGLAAFIGGVLFLISPLLHLAPVAANTGNILPLASVAASIGYLLGSVLVMLGLFGLYTRQSEASGALGLIGFLAAFLGTAMSVGASWTATFISPSLVGVIAQRPNELAPLGFIAGGSMFFLSWLLFGVATLRAPVYPRTAVWLLLIGTIGSALPLPPGPITGFVVVGFNVLFGVAVAYLGFVVFRQEDELEGTEEPHTARRWDG